MRTVLPVSAKLEVLFPKIERPVREKVGENLVVWEDVRGSSGRLEPDGELLETILLPARINFPFSA